MHDIYFPATSKKDPMKYFKVLLAGLLYLSFAAQAQSPVDSAISQVLAPYGRVDVSNGIYPPVIYPQPVIIMPTAVAPPPVYMRVPPGHAKKWAKHCHKYNACNQPVYFVQADKGKKHKNKKNKHDRDEHGHDRH